MLLVKVHHCKIGSLLENLAFLLNLLFVSLDFNELGGLVLFDFNLVGVLANSNNAVASVVCYQREIDSFFPVGLVVVLTFTMHMNLFVLIVDS